MLLIQIGPSVKAYVYCENKRYFGDDPVSWESLSDLGVCKTAEHTYQLGEHRVSHTLPMCHSESLNGRRPLFHLGRMLVAFTHYRHEEGLATSFEKWAQFHRVASGVRVRGHFRDLGGVFRTYEGGVLLAYFTDDQLQLELITETSVISHLKVTTLRRLVELNWEEVEKKRALIQGLHSQMLDSSHFTNHDLPLQLVVSGAVRFAGR